MLRADFESHPIWAMCEDNKTELDHIRENAADGESATAASIEFYLNHILTFREQAGILAEFFVSGMLNPVHAALQEVGRLLVARREAGPGGTGVTEALGAVEQAVLAMGSWPKPFARGAQVAQMQTLYQDLLERQRIDLAALEERHAMLRSELEAIAADAQSSMRSTRDGFEALASDVESRLAALHAETNTRIDVLKVEAEGALATINGYERTIATATATMERTISDLNNQFTQQQLAWQATQEARFDEVFAPHLESIQSRLAEAEESLARLKAVETDFANLSAAAATDKLAGHFGVEAKSGRRTGFWLYIAGGMLVLAAAIPLGLLLVPGALNDDPTIRWEQFAIRAGIGIVLGSGATVAIRLGGRFLARANTAKRMELDLKTFGPFLSSVDDALVSKARLELVDRALARIEPAKESDDSVSMSGLTSVIEAIAKVAK